MDIALRNLVMDDYPDAEKNARECDTSIRLMQLTLTMGVPDFD